MLNKRCWQNVYGSTHKSAVSSYKQDAATSGSPCGQKLLDWRRNQRFPKQAVAASRWAPCMRRKNRTTVKNEWGFEILFLHFPSTESLEHKD